MHSQTTLNPYMPCSFPSVNTSLSSAILPSVNNDQSTTYGSLPTSIQQQSYNTFSFGSFPPLHNSFTPQIPTGRDAETDPHSAPLNNNMCPSAGPHVHLGMPLVTTTTAPADVAESVASSMPDTNIISSSTSVQPNAATAPQSTTITTTTTPNAATAPQSTTLTTTTTPEMQQPVQLQYLLLIHLQQVQLPHQ